VEEEEAVVGNAAGVREWAGGAGEQNVEALVMLLRARDKALACDSELSMATARWRPAGARGGRGARMAGQRGGKRGQGHGEDDAWEEGKQEVDGGGLHSGGRRGSCTGGRAGEQRSRGQRGFRGRRREGGGSEDRFVKTKNFRDPIVKKDFPLI
jgi:hypothetical protein